MSYGSSSYGSAPIGGSAASGWYTFFPYMTRAEGLYEAQSQFTGAPGFFSLFSAQSNTDIPVEYRVYTFNDPAETPQLQVVFSGRGQAVVGTATFIKVTALLSGFSEIFSILGRPGD
jgi:hypothetical protein